MAKLNSKELKALKKLNKLLVKHLGELKALKKLEINLIKLNKKSRTLKN